MTISLLNNFFTKLLLFHGLQNKSKDSVSKTLGVGYYFIDDYYKASKNYSMRQVAQIVTYLRDADLKSKGVGANLNQESILKELVFKILH